MMKGDNVFSGGRKAEHKGRDRHGKSNKVGKRRRDGGKFKKGTQSGIGPSSLSLFQAC